MWAIAQAPPLPPVTPLYQRRAQWQDHSLLLSALQASQPASAALLVTDAAPKAPKVLLLGDQGGAVHLLATDSSLLGSQDTGTPCALAVLQACVVHQLCVRGIHLYPPKPLCQRPAPLWPEGVSSGAGLLACDRRERHGSHCPGLIQALPQRHSGADWPRERRGAGVPAAGALPGQASYHCYVFA